MLSQYSTCKANKDGKKCASVAALSIVLKQAKYWNFMTSEMEEWEWAHIHLITCDIYHWWPGTVPP